MLRLGWLPPFLLHYPVPGTRLLTSNSINPVWELPPWLNPSPRLSLGSVKLKILTTTQILPLEGRE